MSKVISKIDWKLLRKQKSHLVDVLMCNDTLTFKERRAIEGIINLLDSIQDEAALELSDKVVFGKK